MLYNTNGMLSVRAFTAGGALPIQNAVIRITGADENNRFVEFSILTDNDGKTTILALPAPAKSYSLSPSPSEVPYSSYNIEASAAGYYTKKIDNVPIFAATTTTLPINMIPITISGDGEMYPHGNLDTLVKENELLAGYQEDFK